MNKVILMGRLVKDPEVRYTVGAKPIAVARYTLAVNRRFKREGQPEADFINCISMGKGGEFVEKFYKKGQQVGVIGRIQVRSWDDKNGTKHWSTDVIVEEHYFAEGKKADNGNNVQPEAPADGGFYPIDEGIDEDDFPF